MSKKMLSVILILFTLSVTGCGNKDATTNQSIIQLLQGFQQSMVTFFDIKNIQDSSILVTQVNDYMRKMEESKNKLEQINGLAENITDENVKKELSTYIGLGREREKLVINYLNDIRLDLEYKYKSPDAQVDINDYIAKVPNNLLDLEYKSEQSLQRLDKLLGKK